MRTYSCSPTFHDLADVGVFLAFQPNGDTTCEIVAVTLSGTLGQNKSLGVAVDLFKNVNVSGAEILAPAAVVRHDELELESNVTIAIFRTPPALSQADFLGRLRSRRTFWCNDTTQSDVATWNFGSVGFKAKSLKLRGQSRWLCLSTSDIQASVFTGSIVYPSIEWMEA